MRYSEALAAAPPGVARFRPEDLLRLDPWALGLLLAPGPGGLPAHEVRAALEPADYLRLLARTPDRVRHTLENAPAGRAGGARERVVAGAFWVLVYTLEPRLWEELAGAEALPGELLDRLPAAGRIVEVAAGTGRLTVELVRRGADLVAVEPSAPLRALLQARCPSAKIVAALGQALPLRSGWADLVVACASFGPDAPLGGVQVIAELERCAAPGGCVALLGVESPEWFQRFGFERVSAEPQEAPTTPAPLAEVFGARLQPPRDLLLKRL